MKTKKEIEDYFTTTLSAQLDELEGQRLEILKTISYRKYMPYLIGSAVLSLLIYVMIVRHMQDNNNKNLFTGMCFIFVFVTFMITNRVVSLQRNKRFEPCKMAYKSKVLGGVAAFLHQNLSIISGSDLPREAFERSRLFAKADNYESDFLTQGTVFGFPIQIAMVSYFKVSQYEDSKGKRRRSTTTYFEGAYCIIKLETGTNEFVRIKTKSATKDKITNLMPDKNSNSFVKALFSTIVGEVDDSVLVESGNKEFDESFSLRVFDEKTAGIFARSGWIKLLNDFKKGKEWELNFYLNKDEFHVALGGFNMAALNVTSPINECVFTQTYINYVNDLLGLAQEISRNREGTGKTE